MSGGNWRHQSVKSSDEQFFIAFGSSLVSCLGPITKEGGGWVGSRRFDSGKAWLLLKVH